MAGTAVHMRAGEVARRPAPRRASSPPDYVLAIEEKSGKIADPVAKLRFIRGALAHYERTHRTINALPSPVRSLIGRVVRGDAMRQANQMQPLLSKNPNGAAMVGRKRPSLATRLLRPAVALLAAGALAAGYLVMRPAVAAPPRAAPSIDRAPVAESLPALPAGVSPSRIWLVEKAEGYELYSNGLRIDTTHAVQGEPRHYRTFAVKTGMQDTAYDKPVGIVFHTSESDIWPLEETFNGKLRDSSQALLRYLGRNHTYNYLIDRFGQVFRVVEETDKANHAGQGVWTEGDRIFLSLNNAFLGVSFETRWEGGRALPITEAQLAAGRSLTDYLRKRWQIAADMCVTHGLISVNPKKHLIGHHLDWSRGFPFEAFGLPNQYERVSPAVLLFGLGYDEGLTAVLGEPWTGVRVAEERLATEAVERGRTVADLRKERQDLYDTWLQQQLKDQDAAEAQRAPARSAGVKTHSTGPKRIGG